MIKFKVKTSYYLSGIVLVGVIIVSLWVYQKYIVANSSDPVTAIVSRGAITEVVRARGEVVPRAEYNLGFPFEGKTVGVYVREGQEVKAGARLVELDTSAQVFEVQRVAALIDQRSAELDKLMSGATPAQVEVTRAQIESASSSIAEIKKSEVLILREVYAAADDAIRNGADLIFSNPRGFQPRLVIQINNQTYQTDLENKRLQIENTLTEWSKQSLAIDDSSDMAAVSAQTQMYAAKVGSFLDSCMIALGMAVATPSVSESSIDTWESTLATERSNVRTKTSALASIEEKRIAAESKFREAQSTLALQLTPARSEDVRVAQSAVVEAKNQMQSAQEKMSQSILYAPEHGDIAKVNLKKGEIYHVGMNAITLFSREPEIQSDVSELDIAQVHAGAKVQVEFDALPGKFYEGKVISIEPKKIEKDEDTFYRVHVGLDQTASEVRPGMSVSIRVIMSEKQQVLLIPEYAFFKKEGNTYAHVLRRGTVQEVPIEIGITDGENREVVSGLFEGEKVVTTQ